MAARKKTARKKATRKKATAKAAVREVSTNGTKRISKAAKARWAEYRATKSPARRQKLLGVGRTPRKVK